MRLSQALRFSTSSVIAFSGAGGKTSALFQLARERAPAIVTTTTHLGAWQVASADRHLIWEAGTTLPEIGSQTNPGVLLITAGLEGERYRGLVPTQMEMLRRRAAELALPLLIEADGARGKPLKAPGGHEPPIPDFVQVVVVVAGLSGLDRPLTEETVQRAGIFAGLAGQEIGQTLTAAMLVRVLTHPEGGLKNIPARARRIALLNQADTTDLQAQAAGMAGALLHNFDAVVVASLNRPRSAQADLASSIHAVHEPVAGIILAAGESSRFGRPKQLLDYHGQAFVRQVAHTALQAGLSPVVVVTGANAEPVEAALQNLPVTIIRNPAWQSGQSSSIKTGINALPPGVGAAVFLLADQPQVTQHVIQALVERHASERAAIVAALAGGRRANPTLFDSSTFEDLLGISGDVGGRAIFSRHPVDYVEWHDESLLLDVDTEADYHKLLAWGVED